MKRNRLIVLFLYMCSFLFVKAQLSTNEKPFSFGRESEMTISKRSAKPVAHMPMLDSSMLILDNEENENKVQPFRFGYTHTVNFNLNNSGTWYVLPNGDKLWQLNVVCPEALSVNICYDKFWIPEGGKFFVFSKDKKQTIGAFTSRNNKGDRQNIRGFATGLIYGSDIILEYYQPKEIKTDAIISIGSVVHGYKSIIPEEKNLGVSCDLMVNVNCEEGKEWQMEKRAIACVITQGFNYSGFLVTTTSLSGEPLFMTANHCIEDFDVNAFENYSIFVWNYETPGCANVNVNPTLYSTVGATLLASSYYYSDFALLRLSEDPRDLQNFTPYYLGWDCSGQSGEPGVCIHHPKGDVKKISTIALQPTSTCYFSMSLDPHTHWGVQWKSTLNGHGIVQAGSSGSPLLNADHKVIGQLHGSSSNDCSTSMLSWYGKFNVSWTGNNINFTNWRLDCWLDSLNSNVQAMEGLLIISTPETMTTEEHLYSNIRITSTGHLTIQSDVEMMGNSRVIIEAGGELIIDGGAVSNVDLMLNPGASLKIINGGTLETRNGFKAPVGAVVDVKHGKII